MKTQISNTAVFIDTCVFESMHFNFESELCKALESACTSAGVRLLLPDAIHREIIRHINKRIDESVQGLLTLRRKHSVLRLWDQFPMDVQIHRAKQELKNKILTNWHQFRKRLDCLEMDYKDINFQQLMDWYDDTSPPFGAGAKRKEFPDAFAIASLLAYAKSKHEYVSVISSDKDIESACGNHGNLIYFDSMAKYIEVMLVGVEHNNALQLTILKQIKDIEQAILDESHSLEVFHSDDNVYAELLEVVACKILNQNIIAIGPSQCVVYFNAEIEAGIELDLNNGFWWDEFEGVDNIFNLPVAIEGRAVLFIDQVNELFNKDPEIQLDYGNFEAKVNLDQL